MRSLSSIIVLVFMVSCTGREKSHEVLERPNIVFIMSDDHAYQAISAYDDRLIRTPHIDRIAEEGMLFTNACVANSICGPSRATILTGKHAHIHGKIDNDHTVFDTAQVTFPMIFQEAGYQTAMFGKLHFGNNPKGVDEFMILPDQGFYLNPDFITNTGDTTIAGYVTDVITDLSIDWLKNRREEDKPFLMFFLHKAPHRPWWPRHDKFREFSGKTFPEPDNLFDNYEDRGTAARTTTMTIFRNMFYRHDHKIWPETMDEMEDVIPHIEEWWDSFSEPYTDRITAEQHALYKPIIDSISAFFKKFWPGMNDEEKLKWKYQRYMQDYLACISSVDDNVGRMLNYLDASGLSENTIVIYTSDQGFFLGEHGWFDKRFIYEESFKTPLLVRWPGHIEPGGTSDELVQNLDFAQTLLEAAEIEAPTDMQGESFLPILTGDSGKWTRDAVYYHYYEHPGVANIRRHYGIVTRQYKLVHFYYDIDEWELYDRVNDPSEMNNIYDDPQYTEIVSDLTKELQELRVMYMDSEELDQEFLRILEEEED